jgi:uncharacterized protein YdeI (YjbR/CyaY-like superfamily)
MNLLRERQWRKSCGNKAVMDIMSDENLPILSFQDTQALREWLLENHQQSKGIWLQIYKKASDIKSVSFDEVLDEGLCFGWSESKRRSFDQSSYLQCFTPRKKPGTQSQRNLLRAQHLIQTGRMTLFGLKMLGLDI